MIPFVPGWLIAAAEQLPRDVWGTAVGFAAAGYVAGWQDANKAATDRDNEKSDGDPGEL